MKHKRLFSFALAAALLAALGIGIHAAEPIDIGVDTGDTGGAWLDDTPMITAYDVETHFQDYAQDDSKVTFPQTGFALFPRELPGGSAVGVILDDITETPISGATISVDGTPLVTTDENGRFQIDHVPDGYYDWDVSAPDYQPGHFKNYDVHEWDGASIFRFYIRKDQEVVRDHLDYVGRHGTPADPPTEALEEQSYDSRTMSSIPSVSNTVRLSDRGTIRTLKRQDYIAVVVASEAYDENTYKTWGLSDDSITQYYCAQAMACNTFLEYAKSVYSNHRGSGYDVCSSDCCQVYDSSKTNSRVTDAVQKIFYKDGQKKTVIVLREPSNNKYDYVWGAFFSSCGNNGTKTHATDPALKSVSCSDLRSGAGGHRYGMCQMGAANLAKKGYNAAQIMRYYYNSCDVELCPLVDT